VACSINWVLQVQSAAITGNAPLYPYQWDECSLISYWLQSQSLAGLMKVQIITTSVVMLCWSPWYFPIQYTRQEQCVLVVPSVFDMFLPVDCYPVDWMSSWGLLEVEKPRKYYRFKYVATYISK